MIESAPFENMSGDPEQEYFADGMVEEIITARTSTRCSATVCSSCRTCNSSVPDKQVKS